MVVANNEIDETKNAGKSTTILDAAIGRVPAPYRPDGRHGRRIRIKHTKH